MLKILKKKKKKNKHFRPKRRRSELLITKRIIMMITWMMILKKSLKQPNLVNQNHKQELEVDLQENHWPLIINHPNPDHSQERRRKILLFTTILREESSMRQNLRNIFQIRIRKLNKRRNSKNTLKKTLIGTQRVQILQQNLRRDSNLKKVIKKVLNTIMILLFHKIMMRLLC